MDARLAAGDPAGALEIGLVDLVGMPPAAVEAFKQSPSWSERLVNVRAWPREGRELLRMPLGTDALRDVRLHTVMLLGEQCPGAPARLHRGRRRGPARRRRRRAARTGPRGAADRPGDGRRDPGATPAPLTRITLRDRPSWEPTTPGATRRETPVPRRRTAKAAQHEQNKRMIVELTAWITVAVAVLVVALHAGISATSTAADVPRVTTAEYR
jgi:hypothetical protein